MKYFLAVIVIGAICASPAWSIQPEESSFADSTRIWELEGQVARLAKDRDYWQSRTVALESKLVAISAELRALKSSKPVALSSGMPGEMPLAVSREERQDFLRELDAIPPRPGHPKFRPVSNAGRR